MKKIFIIAGEASGDLLAADLLKALKMNDPEVEIYGIGGASSLSAGLPCSLFSMEELSIMGVAEIVPKIPHMLKRIKQTVQEIERLRPDLLLTIDAPDFSFRVQKSLKAKNLKIKQVHYVAPTVWAWRAGRAQKIARFLDGILCLFPFEPPYFEKEGLPAIYTGHPVMERYKNAPSQEEAKKTLGFKKEETVLGLLLGSRRGELKNHSSIFFQAIEEKVEKGFQILVPTLPHLQEEIETKIKAHFKVVDQFKIVSNPLQQTIYFRAMESALAVSGTVGLELAVADVPHIIAYRAHPITASLLRTLVRVEYAHLANIILKKLTVPEYIQNACTPDNLTQALNEIDIARQRVDFQSLRTRLETKHTPSETARDFMLDL